MDTVGSIPVSPPLLVAEQVHRVRRTRDRIPVTLSAAAHWMPQAFSHLIPPVQ